MFAHWEARNGPHLHTESHTAHEVNYKDFKIFAMKYQEEAGQQENTNLDGDVTLLSLRNGVMYSYAIKAGLGT